MLLVISTVVCYYNVLLVISVVVLYYNVLIVIAVAVFVLILPAANACRPAVPDMY